MWRLARVARCTNNLDPRLPRSGQLATLSTSRKLWMFFHIWTNADFTAANRAIFSANDGLSTLVHILTHTEHDDLLIALRYVLQHCNQPGTPYRHVTWSRQVTWSGQVWGHTPEHRSTASTL